MGVLAISVASILIRLCSLPPLTIACWRLSLATLFFIAVGLAQRLRWRALRGPELALAVLAGLFLALHFATWISSLSYTSVASSVVLVATSPLWVALGSALFLGECVGGATWVGIGLAIAGSTLVGMAAEAVGTRGGLLGDGLALAGAICGAGYILIGRRLRESVALVEYVSVVYGAAAVILCVMALAAGSPLHGFSSRDWMLLVGIAALPQVVGHSLLNWALRYVSSTRVALAALGEPIGATALAWLVLHEPLLPLQGLGCALILMGVASAHSRKTSR